MTPQRRRLAIAMSASDQDALLRRARTCRLATVDAHGWPRVTPVWFWWDGQAIWVRSLLRSQRWSDVLRDPHVSLVVDVGDRYEELRGVELTGRAQAVPDVDDPSSARDSPGHAVDRVTAGFAEKYDTSPARLDDGRHGWLRIEVDGRFSWDHTLLTRTGR